MNFLGSFLKSIKPRNDDDAADRLNYYYSVLVISIFSLTISAKQYVGAPIQCWVPAHFKKYWEEYAENYCFVQNTYWLPLHDPIPRLFDTRDSKQLGYYQWVPFILAIEAILFYFPAIVWRQLNWRSGVSLLQIVDMAADTKNVEISSRDKAVHLVVRHIEDAIDLQREFREKSSSFFLSVLLQCGKTKGTYVSLVYLSCKVLYILNIGVQFVLMEFFLAPKHPLWGMRILNDLIQGRSWEDTGSFPRVTYCDFEVRMLGNIHRYTIQCVLMINMFNEKIFVFLWWWFVLVALVSIVNTIFTFIQMTSHHRQFALIARYLRVTDSVTKDDAIIVNKFVTEHLRPDGVLIIRMIANHAGDLVATDIVHKLWKNFTMKQKTEAKVDNETVDKELLETFPSAPELDPNSNV